MNYRKVATKLKQLECSELKRYGKGSHRGWLNSRNQKIATLPYHGDKDVPIGTLRATVKDLGIDWETFKNA